MHDGEEGILICFLHAVGFKASIGQRREAEKIICTFSMTGGICKSL